MRNTADVRINARGDGEGPRVAFPLEAIDLPLRQSQYRFREKCLMQGSYRGDIPYPFPAPKPGANPKWIRNRLAPYPNQRDPLDGSEHPRLPVRMEAFDPMTGIGPTKCAGNSSVVLV